MNQTSLTSHSSQPYYATIGVIGHVDHGKTTLIQSLTGILTARPHEQKLGMTQDLGFAYFRDEKNNVIGIVDVPGHERYIRNMVSGIAHLNAVVLVISATEGWMPMTTDHVRIAQALGQTNIIICINKKDLVSSETLAHLEERCLETLMDMTGLVPEVVSVSALTHEGIDTLKKTIIQALASKPKHQEENSPPARLYVDRSFTVNGIGTVVTGTLGQGKIALDDKLYITPSKQAVKVRSLQAYHQERESVQGVSRVAIALKGVKRQAIQRGDCLTSEPNLCHISDQLIVRLSDSIQHLPPLKSNKNIEVALGSWHGFGQLIGIKETQLVRIKLTKAAPIYFGQPIALMQHGGSRLLHGGFIVWTKEINGFTRRRLYQLLNQLPLPIHANQSATLALSLNGFIKKADIKEKQIPSNIVAHDQWVFDSQWLKESCSKIETYLSAPNAAISANELSSYLKMDIHTIHAVTQYLKHHGKIHLSYGNWILGDGDSEDDLSQEAQTLLTQIRNKKKRGFELNKEPLAPAEKAQLRNLARLRYIVQIEGDIYYDIQLYLSMVEAILTGHNKGDCIDMAHIKEKSELSRKYAIPLANRMEKDGWVRRDENQRIILKAYD